MNKKLSSKDNIHRDIPRKLSYNETVFKNQNICFLTEIDVY